MDIYDGRWMVNLMVSSSLGMVDEPLNHAESMIKLCFQLMNHAESCIFDHAQSIDGYLMVNNQLMMVL